eukprot:TRINITY_DN22168_c0_g1_i2.p1 TRINITY_DN22168_c0_g1~~TRINITY_DN22168_c0_g1_i2.p1  ORF type:complete len:1171 (-),score=263.01 TRINITY_DN22168_c0_g1_i2:185-3697(-)
MSAEMTIEEALEKVNEEGWENMVWPRGFSPLHQAARDGNAELVASLLEKKANASDRDDIGLRPLDYAAQSGHTELVKQLQEHLQIGTTSSIKQAQQSAKSDAGRMLLQSAFQAAISGRKPFNPNDEVDVWSTSQNCWLRGRVQSCQAGLVTVVYNLPNGQCATKSLPESSCHEHLKHVVMEDAKSAPDVSSAPSKSQTAELPAGLDERLVKPCQVVASKGMHPDKWPHKHTPLHLAAKLGSVVGVKFLLDVSASPALDVVDDLGKTPLDYAKVVDDPKLVAVLSGTQAIEITPAMQMAIDKFRRLGKKGTTELDGLTSEKELTPVMQMALARFKAMGKRAGTRTMHDSEATQQEAHQEVELDKARAWALKDKDPDTLGLKDLKILLMESEAERAKLQKLVDSGSSLSTGEAKGGVQSPLDPSGFEEFLPQLKNHSREVVLDKLRQPAIAGGAGLSDGDAHVAISQLEFLARIIAETNLVFKDRDDKEDSNPTVGKGKPQGPSPPGGKGRSPDAGAKGKKGAPPLPGQKGSAEHVDEDAPQPKGQGKKAPPPPPPGKGEKAQPPPPPGKGGKAAPPPPPGKGGKAPPPPPPGKGEKGPPPPGGKGAKGPPPGVGKGKGKKGRVEPSKPVVKPKEAMKSLQWTRLLIGDKLEKGCTIWDLVPDLTDAVPVDEMVARFSKNASRVAVNKDESAGPKKAEVKEIQIIPSNNRLPYEIAVRSLPSVDVITEAIADLDEGALSPEAVRDLMQWFCSDPSSLEQLEAMGKARPELPVAKPEQYMMVVGKIPAVRMRLSCWDFVRSLPENLDLYEERVKLFESMVDAFRESKLMPSILGLVLAFGNYLNGGNSRLGQADGFNLDTLVELNSVKDARGKELRYLLFETLCQERTEEAQQLLSDLAPFFVNMQRMMSKGTGDDGDHLAKKVIVRIEDFNGIVNKLENDINERKKEFKNEITFITDPADMCRLRMPDLLQKAEDRIRSFISNVERAKTKFADLLKWYYFEEMPKTFKDENGLPKTKVEPVLSDDWCTLWDNFFFPPENFERKDDKTKNEFFVPRYCKDKELDVEDLEVYWDIKDPKEILREQLKKARAEQKKKEKGNRRTQATKTPATKPPMASRRARVTMPPVGSMRKSKPPLASRRRAATSLRATARSMASGSTGAAGSATAAAADAGS